MGSVGAPETGGVAPAANVVVRGKVACEGMPDVISLSGTEPSAGMIVLVGVAAAARPRNVVRDVKDTTKMETTVSSSDLLKLVNPFIGTTNGGNVFPGELQPTSNLTIC